MSEETHAPAGLDEPSPGAVAQLLDVVANHSVEGALVDLERLIARLRAEAEEAAQAREVLVRTPAAVLREAVRLRAAGRRDETTSAGAAGAERPNVLHVEAAAAGAGGMS